MLRLPLSELFVNVQNSMKKILLLIIVVAMGVIFYAYAFRKSLSDIDVFCNSIDQNMHLREVELLADELGVTLRGPVLLSDSSGSYVFIEATSGFTVGEYGCRLRVDGVSNRVVRKTLR